MVNPSDPAAAPSTPESGFTLVEALIAIVILIFGLMAIANLYAIAGGSNSVANQATAATTLATEQMERLKARRFPDLSPGGNLDSGGTMDSPGTNEKYDTVPGVGIIRTRWRISDVSGDTQVKFIQVRSEGIGVVSGQRSRAEFTAFRVCTTGSGCP